MKNSKKNLRRKMKSNRKIVKQTKKTQIPAFSA